MISPIVVERRDRLLVVRDDYVPGGTKRRVLAPMLRPGCEYVYASPAQGYAQVALAYAAAEVDARATVFVAKRTVPHALTMQARQLGAKVLQVPVGYMSVVRARARAYCQANGAEMLPFGLDTPEFVNALAALASGLDVNPSEVWSVAGSGTLSRALQKAWPAAKVYAVRIGAEPKVGSATVLTAPERFEQNAQKPPPFPSCANYDAKAWRFIRAQAQPGALFWNVAA